jgi:hypothetical protein
LLPPPEVQAVVTVGPVPSTPTASLREAVEPLLDRGRIVGWKLTHSTALRTGRVAEFLAWRRAWATSWSMGPVANVHALLDTAALIGLDVGEDLRSALGHMCLAERGEEEFAVTGADLLDTQVEALVEALTTTSAHAHGVAIIDDTVVSRSASRVLRTWVAPRSQVLLTATTVTSVVLDPQDGLVILYGDPRTVALRRVVQVDLTGAQALITNQSGQQLEMPSDHARPIAWLAPNSVRWHLGEIPLVEVWRSLFEGLPHAVSTARRAGTSVRFTTDVLAV